MPNHIANKLSINGTKEQVKRVFDFVKSETSDFDFNNIIQMPSSLNIESGTSTDLGMEYLLYQSDNIAHAKHKKSYELLTSYDEKTKSEYIELGEKALLNVKLHGYKDWYDWRIANWGTKWNAYDVYMEDDNTIFFFTAWDGVPDLVSRLSTIFPDVELEYIFADEDTSYNTGRLLLKNGVLESYYPDGGSDDAFELYFETHPDDKDMYEKVNGEWMLVEEF